MNVSILVWVCLFEHLCRPIWTLPTLPLPEETHFYNCIQPKYSPSTKFHYSLLYSLLSLLSFSLMRDPVKNKMVCVLCQLHHNCMELDKEFSVSLCLVDYLKQICDVWTIGPTEYDFLYDRRRYDPTVNQCFKNQNREHRWPFFVFKVTVWFY